QCLVSTVGTEPLQMQAGHCVCCMLLQQMTVVLLKHRQGRAGHPRNRQAIHASNQHVDNNAVAESVGAGWQG
ncbi:MAG: hypothetical protein L0H29_09095, partial [Sinobacteraceae bacterium]|nr:hypothetical protein [Nevskiaceae bacterium]